MTTGSTPTRQSDRVTTPTDEDDTSGCVFAGSREYLAQVSANPLYRHPWVQFLHLLQKTLMVLVSIWGLIRRSYQGIAKIAKHETPTNDVTDRMTIA